MAEAKRHVTWREFLQWRAYYDIKPFGDDWEQSATIATLIRNAWFKGRGVTPDAFIPGDHRGNELARRKELIRKLERLRHGNDRPDRC